MGNLLDKEYIHVGTDDIKRELWINLYKDQFHNNNIKPAGGIWCSNYDDNLGDWVNYLRKNGSDAFYYILRDKKCSFVKFKNDAKFLKIDTNEDLKNLRDSGFIIDLEEPEYVNINHLKQKVDFTLDFDKIKNYYDLFYLNIDLDKSFDIFRVNTMLALKPDAIEYFKPLDVDYYRNIALKVFDKKTIKEPKKEYYDFLLYIKYLFDRNSVKNLDELKTLRENIIKHLKDNLHKNYLSLSDINKDLLIDNNVTNQYFEKMKHLKLQ